MIYDYIDIIIINPYPFWLKPSRIRPPPNFFPQACYVGGGDTVGRGGEESYLATQRYAGSLQPSRLAS